MVVKFYWILFSSIAMITCIFFLSLDDAVNYLNRFCTFEVNLHFENKLKPCYELYFLIHCLIWFANILLRTCIYVHEWDWRIVFLSCQVFSIRVMWASKRESISLPTFFFFYLLNSLCKVEMFFSLNVW